MADELINGTDSVPGDLRLYPRNFREYDESNPQFGSVTDFCVAAEQFAEETFCLKLSDALADLEGAVAQAANERELRYKKAFEERKASAKQLGNLSYDIGCAADHLTRMYGGVLVLRDYVDGKLEATPREERTTPMSYPKRLCEGPTAYEVSVRLRLKEVRDGILKRLQ